MKSVLKLAVVALAASLASCGNNNGSTTTEDSTNMTSTAPMDGNMTSANAMSDQDFVTKASAANAAEIAAHQSAQTHAMSADVKTHAKHMLADHQKLADEMKSLAAKKGWTLSDAAPPEKQQELDQMNQKNGADWDKAYVDSQLQAHQDAINLFESASASVQDSDLKALIDKTLPTLRDHLQMVQDMQGKMNK